MASKIVNLLLLACAFLSSAHAEEARWSHAQAKKEIQTTILKMNRCEDFIVAGNINYGEDLAALNRCKSEIPNLKSVIKVQADKSKFIFDKFDNCIGAIEYFDLWVKSIDKKETRSGILSNYKTYRDLSESCKKLDLKS